MRTIMKKVALFAPLALVLVLVGSGPADAQRLHGRLGPRVVPAWGWGYGHAPYYDPFWWPFSYGAYPYVVLHPTAAVRVDVIPKQAEVFVDGYFAGTAGTVRTTPGGHSITVFLPGYRTVTRNVYVEPGHTFTMKDTMETVGAGEVSAPPPVPSPRMLPEAPPNKG